MTCPDPNCPRCRWQRKELTDHAADARRALFVAPRSGKTLVEVQRKTRLGAARGLTIAPLAVCPDWAALLRLEGREVIEGYRMTVAELVALLKRKPSGVELVLNYDKVAYGYRDEKVIGPLLRWGASDLTADECFPAGTLVDGRPIESLAVGDTVLAFDDRTGHVVRSTITHAGRKRPDTLIEICAHGKTIRCTANHPFWTNRGWQVAGKLRADDRIAFLQRMRRRNTDIKQIAAPTPAYYRRGVLQLGMRIGSAHSKVDTAHAGQQPHALHRNARKDDRYNSPHRAQTESAWRERHRIDYGGSLPLVRAGERVGATRCADETTAHVEVSQSLQNRFSAPNSSYCDRGRRPIAFLQKGAGCKEDCAIDFVRVDSVTLLEQTSDGTYGGVCPDGFVYNIEVAEQHTYIAEGFVVHNSHWIAEPSSNRGRATRRLAFAAESTRMLTGTPSPRHYGSLWGQMVCLDREAFFPSFAQFRARYLICSPQFPTQVLGHQNVEELQAKMLRYATILSRTDIFGPDAWIPIKRSVPLPPKARAFYDTLAKEWIAEPEPHAETRADHRLKRMLRLAQVAGGAAHDDLSHGLVTMHDAKIDRLLADLSEIVYSGEKAVISHRFRFEGARLMERIPKEVTKHVRRIAGSDLTSLDERKAAERWFQAADGPAVLVVQPQAGGIGINLNQASHIMRLSRDYSFTQDEQMRDRVYSWADGKALARCIYDYEAENTVDEFIAGTLDAKETIHHAVMRASREEMAYGYIKRAKKSA